MLAFAKVTSKYQVTIPSEIRDILNLQGGDHIVFHVQDGGEVTIRVMKSVSVDDLAGALSKAALQPIEYIPFEQARQMAKDEMSEKFRDTSVDQGGTGA